MRHARCARLVFLAVLVASPFAVAADLAVRSQVVGPMSANSYLLYDSQSKDAAIFDVPGPVDSLVQTIKEKGLKLKYVFITHAHCDHVFGLPELMKAFPNAQVRVSQQEYEDSALYLTWAEKLDPKQVEEIRKNAELVRMMDFDLRSIGKPAAWVKDGDTFRLGDAEIRAFLSPGHSRGGVCYEAGKMLFSGDVLFYRNVGRTGLPGSGGWEQIVKSVRRLYSSLPDNTGGLPGTRSDDRHRFGKDTEPEGQPGLVKPELKSETGARPGIFGPSSPWHGFALFFMNRPACNVAALAAKPVIDGPGNHGADNRCNPEEPELRNRPSSHHECGTSAPSGIDRKVRHGNADQVDERESQSDCQRCKTTGRTLVSRAEDDYQEHEGEDDLGQQAGN